MSVTRKLGNVASFNWASPIYCPSNCFTVNPRISARALISNVGEDRERLIRGKALILNLAFNGGGRLF